jgi:UDP-3-O-acyl-N-acetylglucosamine deacetylase
MTASLTGRALHGGGASTVTCTLRPGPDDGLGLRFFFPGFAAPLDFAALGRLRRSARRATILSGDAGSAILTPEHLLAAALFFADAPLDVRCDAAEPPGLDGSARPWFELFRQTAGSGFAPGARERDRAITWAHEGPEGRLTAEPAPRFSVEYVLERGDFYSAYALHALEDAPREVLPARTFIFHRDWKGLAGARDLLAGADGDSGLLLAESEADFAEARAAARSAGIALRGGVFPLLHPESARFADEPARHKVLDLLGDLALGGPALPRLRLRIRNGGHALNHLLLERLQ